jgi:putative ABC transport system permease protein
MPNASRPTHHRATILAAELRESFHMAMSALAAHKLRSALTLLGVLVGVFSIIVVMTAMRVMQGDIEHRIRRFGSQTFMVRKWPGVYFGGSEGFEAFWRRKDITLSQGLQVQEKATLAVSVGLEGQFWGGQVETRFKKTAPTVQLFGETPDSFGARDWVAREGRVLLDMDVEGARDVCVLAANLATNVFPYGSAVGERLKINGCNYTVVGVLEPRGASRGGNQDNFAIVPVTTGLNRFGRWNRTLSILVQTRNQASFDDTVEQVRGILRVVRKVPPGKPDDFEIFSNDSMITQFHDFTIKVRIGVALVSSIALLAAGIGIMNIMLVSVTERTREIGIRRAVGAKKRNIMTQFIMEAVVICEVGGAVGVVLGILGGNALAYFMKLTPVVPVDWVIIGLVICSIVGIIFGTYPAFKAAHLDPIESLRYE